MNMKGKRGINKIMYANEEMNVDACKEMALAFISLCELFDISVDNYIVIIDGFLANDRYAYTSISDLDFSWTKKEYRKMMDVISKALNDYNSIERRYANKVMYATDEVNVDTCKEMALAFISLCELFDISVEKYRVIIVGFLADDRNDYTSISDLGYIWTNKEYRKMMYVISKALNDYNSIERRWEDETKAID